MFALASGIIAVALATAWTLYVLLVEPWDAPITLTLPHNFCYYPGETIYIDDCPFTVVEVLDLRSIRIKPQE